MKEGHTEVPSHVHGLLAAMVFFWSLNFVVAKLATREFPPVLVAGMRFALAGSLVWPLYRWKRGSGLRKLSRRSILQVAGLGVLGIGMNQLFFVIGIQRTSVAHAGLVIALSPMTVLLLAAAIGQERITGRKLAGLLIAISGVAVLQLAPGRTVGASPLGDLFIFLAGFTFALFTVFGRSVVRQYDSLTVNTIAYVGSGIGMAPVAIWYGSDFPFATVSLTAWASVAYMALFPSLFCYLIYYYALGFIPASKVAALSYLQPVLATLMAIVLIGEHLTTSLLIGGVLILAGVLVAERA